MNQRSTNEHVSNQNWDPTAHYKDKKVAERYDDERFSAEAVLCARVLTHFPVDSQAAVIKGVASLITRRVVINHSLDAPYRRLRRRIKRHLGHQAPARFPASGRQIAEMLREAGLREVRRYRMNRLFSEAVYIVAEK